jgi:hypothetical protein
VSWTIKGEAGAALDATVRTLASLNISSAKLSLASLDADTFTWSAATHDASGSPTIIPDAGQLVEVFHNGTRRFRGHVTIPRVSLGRVEVTCEGPWWWWNRIPLTQVQTDDTAATAERPSYVFPTQALKTSLEALIDRAIANGVPIIRGTVATMFDFPRITLTEKSCAQALADLMSICPDAVAYYDYSAASGNPTLNITRRGVMTDTTLTPGTDAIEEIDVYPRLDLEVAQIKIGSVTRNATTGANQWATQTSGTATPGKNQIIVVSGPEVNDYLPKDRFDQFQVQTFAMPTGGIAYGTLNQSSPYTATSVSGAAKDFVLAKDPTLATLIRELGTAFSSGLVLTNGGRYGVSLYTTGNMNGAYHIFLDKPNLISTAPTAGMQVVSSADRVPDWAAWENGYTVTDATFSCYVRWTKIATVEPTFWEEVARYCERRIGFGYVANQSGQTVGNYQFNIFFKVNIPCQLINASFGALTTIYRQWDYDYVTPPAGLAGNLLAAQNWIPYEGRILQVADTVDGAQDLHRKFNLAGSLAAHASMAALPRAIQYDIASGRKTIMLGSPARTDFGTLASRFRRSPRDNIIYL